MEPQSSGESWEAASYNAITSGSYIIAFAYNRTTIAVLDA